jgi:Do/DeqQ family serine protease
MNKFLGFTFAGLIGGISSLAAYHILLKPDADPLKTGIVQEAPAHLTSMPISSLPPEGAIDFTTAAEISVNAVVHIRTVSKAKNASMFRDPIQEFFFGAPGMRQPVVGSGSGVIISADGYIVTNNHVIDGADKVEVTLNNKFTYTADVVGRDPSTDLALIKIDADGLPYLQFANSDEVKVGEWVLAVGNPFNLNSTVTAGIVSAKTRRIDIIHKDLAIESFIQTDAAVNQGNSGGALVNTRGELVGINSAIASTTGSYTGYSFAIPANLVKKVVNDLAEYGNVQRAFLGVVIKDLTPDLAKKAGQMDLNGVYVEETLEKGAAKEAGIKTGDIIKKVGDIPVAGFNALQEQVALYRPGDRVNVTVTRNGEEKVIPVVLKNKEGNSNLYKRNDELLALLGADFEKFSNAYGNIQGLKVVNLKSGKLKAAGVKEGFLITKVNGQPVKDRSDLESILSQNNESVYLEGIYPNGQKAYYAFGF